MSKAIIQHLKHNEVKQYIEDNCKALGNGFYEVVNDLKVWKKTATYRGCNVVVALLIPKHAVIYAGCLKSPNLFNMHMLYRKMRASKAIVVEQFKVPTTLGRNRSMHVVLRTESLKAVNKSYSKWDYDFLYETSAIVEPSQDFSWLIDECRPGVHFFVNLTDALMY